MRDVSRSSVACFGPFRLDLTAGELCVDGRRIRLQEQPFQLLKMLIEGPGEVLTRDEIRQQLWPNGTVVEFDHSINAAIKKLRIALKDSADEPRYVETVARRGYRLMLPVERAEQTRLVAAEMKISPDEMRKHSESDKLLRIAPPEPRGRRRSWALAGVAVLLIGMASVGLWLRVSRSQTAPKIVPLTSYPGFQVTPAFSPDSKQMAFAWDGEKGDNFDIHVKLVDAGTPLKLTINPAHEYGPAWSPDGRFIAFYRALEGHTEIWMKPALGG